MVNGGILSDLCWMQPNATKRISSYDKTGRNNDFWRIQSGECKKIAEIDGPGCITHIWMAQRGASPFMSFTLPIRSALKNRYWLLLSTGTVITRQTTTQVLPTGINWSRINPFSYYLWKRGFRRYSLFPAQSADQPKREG